MSGRGTHGLLLALPSLSMAHHLPAHHLPALHHPYQWGIMPFISEPLSYLTNVVALSSALINKRAPPRAVSLPFFSILPLPLASPFFFSGRKELWAEGRRGRWAGRLGRGGGRHHVAAAPSSVPARNSGVKQHLRIMTRRHGALATEHEAAAKPQSAAGAARLLSAYRITRLHSAANSSAGNARRASIMAAHMRIICSMARRWQRENA